MADAHFPSTKSTIMVVDDEPELATILRLMLERKGYSVRCAYSGPQLLAGLEEQKPDLILLDVMMPEMDGLEVLTRLKGNPDTANIPVILLTAKVLYEDVLGGYKMGADYYITKPFTKTQLLDGINLIFSGGQRHSNGVNQFIKA